MTPANTLAGDDCLFPLVLTHGKHQEFYTAVNKPSPSPSTAMFSGIKCPETCPLASGYARTVVSASTVALISAKSFELAEVSLKDSVAKK